MTRQISSKKEWEYICDLSADENGFTNGAAGIAWEDFLSDYVPKRRQFESGNGLASALVRQIDFFLWCDGEIAGLFRIRPELNDFLRTVTGGSVFRLMQKRVRCAVAVLERLYVPPLQYRMPVLPSAQ